jgi:hypothetical protein
MEASLPLIVPVVGCNVGSVGYLTKRFIDLTK